MSSRIPIGVFYRVHRGGGVHSVAINQRGGAVLAHLAARTGLHPAHLTLAALQLGAAAGIALAIIAPALPVLEASERITVAVAVWITLQAAYCLDCADGQLARVTGRASGDGASLDIFCDVVVQTAFAAGLASVAAAFNPAVGAWELSVWGSAWIATLVTSQAAKDGADVSLIRSRSPLVQAVKLVRDYGAQVTAAGALLAIWPAGVAWLLWTITAANAAVLTGLIVRSARRSMTEPAHESITAANTTRHVSTPSVGAGRLRSNDEPATPGQVPSRAAVRHRPALHQRGSLVRWRGRTGDLAGQSRRHGL